MAVAFEAFSIREYAAKMRSVDVFKCCPFIDDDHGDDDKVMSREEAESLLPPITVTKFKLWSHELDRIKSNFQPQEEETLITLTNKESAEEIPSNDDRQFTAMPETHEEEEVEVAEKASGSTFVTPVCKDFEAASANAVHAHASRCLVHASREEPRPVGKRGGAAKAKSKAPKKRSIADIFAVAPPIPTVDETNEEEVCEEDSDLDQILAATILEDKAKRRKKQKPVVLLEDNNNCHKKFNKKKTKKNKENSCKLKQQSPVNFAKKLHKKVAVDVSDPGTGRARTPNVKNLCTEKRKVAQTSKFIPKQKRPVSPTRSILKNHLLCRQNSTYRMEHDNQENTCGFQHLRRHVRFSGKDAILGPSKNEKSSFEHNLFSDTLTSSSEKDQSADSDKEASPVEVDRRENDVSVGTDNGIEAFSKAGRNEYPELDDHVGIPSFLRTHINHQEKAKHLAEKSEPANTVAAVPDTDLHMFNQGYLTTAREPAYAGIPRLISALEDSCEDTQGDRVPRGFGPSGKMIDHFVHPDHGVSAPSSKENSGAFFEPSIRNFISNENAQGRVQFLSQSEGDRMGDRVLRYQSICPPMNIVGGDRMSDHGLPYQSIRPPMDIVGSSYHFPQWKQRPLTFTERLLDDKFYGLPLNSHGELIQFSSKGGSGFDQLGKLNTVARSSSSLPAYNQHFQETELPTDQLNLFPLQNHVRGNSSSQFTDRVGITYFGNAQRPDVHQLDFESRSRHSFRPLNSDLDLFSISSSRCRQFDQVQNENIGRMVPKEISCPMPLNMNQPTMRLMGKDVAIGNSSRQIQGFEDEKVWMDKEIITEHCPSNNSLLNPLLKQNFHQKFYQPTTSTKMKEMVSECSEQAQQSNLRMKAPEFRFPHPYQACHSSSGFEYSSHTTSKSPTVSCLHFSQSPSPAMFNGEHNFRTPFIPRTESLQSQLFGSQPPVFSTPQVTYEHGILRPETSYKPHQPHFRKSAFDFPFLNPECRENFQPSWFQNSSKAGLPPWLLHATLQRNPPITPPQAQVFPSTTSKYLHHIMPRNNNLNAPSMHYSSESSHLQVKRSQVPQTAASHQCFQVIPEENPSSAMMSYRNRKDLKGRMKPQRFGIKDLYPCKKTKRLAVDSTNLPNIINLEVQEKSRVMAGLSSNGDFIDEMQSNFRALGLESSQKQASGSECILHETRKDGLGSFRIESSKVDDVGRSGPMKLSAGAKHIIKPTPNVEQDNCRPMHSTIPFVAATNGCTEPDPQTKSTKIYKF
ncbi:uncharacterized protein LOC126798898 [Argentina anserina]|uniref:uncharacterized protein LOC126798898 n=1 Tax=Argentina anserina TaxID=57926 RepID=UPI0021767672|nr:uncharacterized protein LOC126798898 [Potentilla anserina]